ncbi:hypothetical protein DFR69_1221, partial [Nocardia neocaledoniensis]
RALISDGIAVKAMVPAISALGSTCATRSESMSGADGPGSGGARALP